MRQIATRSAPSAGFAAPAFVLLSFEGPDAHSSAGRLGAWVSGTFGFERVPWRELDETATITTVSRFMKQHMWRFGVDAPVIPNGIAPQWLAPHDRSAVAALRRSIGQRLLLVKVARWDPDKRWLMAMDAVGELKARGLRPERTPAIAGCAAGAGCARRLLQYDARPAGGFFPQTVRFLG